MNVTVKKSRYKQLPNDGGSILPRFVNLYPHLTPALGAMWSDAGVAAVEQGSNFTRCQATHLTSFTVLPVSMCGKGSIVPCNKLTGSLHFYSQSNQLFA